MIPDEAAMPLNNDEAPRKARWRQADVKRAIDAAKAAGLDSYRVEIAPDGTITIVVPAPPEAAACPESWSDLLRP